MAGQVAQPTWLHGRRVHVTGTELRRGRVPLRHQGEPLLPGREIAPAASHPVCRPVPGTGRRRVRRPHGGPDRPIALVRYQWSLLRLALRLRPRPRRGAPLPALVPVPLPSGREPGHGCALDRVRLFDLASLFLRGFPCPTPSSSPPPEPASRSPGGAP